MNELRVGLIGYGAIGSCVAEAIRTVKAGRTILTSVLCRDTSKYERAMADLSDVVFTDDPERFFTTPFDLVAEAAGKDALRSHGNRVLESGRDLLVTSIGAFTDDDFFQQLSTKAEERKVRLLLASGALPAVDWMHAVAPAGVRTVVVEQRKPVASWRGTQAEGLVDLDELDELVCFFRGSAREAASTFPKSSNIAAMLALSTAGMDATKVQLYADPVASEMHTTICFESNAGSLRVDWKGVPTEQNPSTSADVPLTVIKALRNLTSPVCYGP